MWPGPRMKWRISVSGKNGLGVTTVPMPSDGS
jgi:hypothetical protein